VWFGAETVKHPSAAKDNDWLRLAVGIAQLSLAIWLLVAWLVGAPTWVLLILAILSFVTVGFSLLRWKRRRKGSKKAVIEKGERRLD